MWVVFLYSNHFHIFNPGDIKAIFMEPMQGASAFFEEQKFKTASVYSNLAHWSLCTLKAMIKPWNAIVEAQDKEAIISQAAF